jgi:glucose/arabinose dehydrogenase
MLLAPTAGLSDDGVRSGANAFGDWREDAAGVRRLITPADLPAPYATPSSSNPSQPSPRPPSALPKAPAGFAVDLLADGLVTPRVIRVAPNGDIFVAESGAGRLRVFRVDEANGKSVRSEVFAKNLPRAFGIAFYPSGDNPHWVYAATESSVVRFPYRVGDLKASGSAQLIVPNLPTGSHWTRDLAFSLDDRTLFVSVGSASDDASGPASVASRLLGGWRDRGCHINHGVRGGDQPDPDRFGSQAGRHCRCGRRRSAARGIEGPNFAGRRSGREHQQRPGRSARSAAKQRARGSSQLPGSAG